MSQERELLNEAREQIQRQQEQLEELANPSAVKLGTVMAVYSDSIVVSSGDGLFQLMNQPTTKQFKPGDTVCLHPMTSNLIGKSDYERYGKTGTVQSIGTDFIEVIIDGSSTFVSQTRVKGLETGDRVLCDVTNTIIVKKLESEAEKYLFAEQVNLDWSEIGGCDEAKKELRGTIEKPMQHSKLFAAFKKKTPKGFLLHGRPGNGKTMLGKAVATAIAKAQGKQAAPSAFCYVKGPAILDKFVGETEKMIRALFEQCRQHKQKHGYPAVMFVDEADAILANRTSSKHIGLGMTVVPQFLSEMDGLVDSAAIVILATNRPDTLDPAVIRPGRVDHKLYIAPPSKENATDHIAIHMREIPTSEDDLASRVTEELYTESYPLYRMVAHGQWVFFGLKDLISGAMLASIVEQATSNAIDRNIESKSSKINGVNFCDFQSALKSMQKSQYGLNHELEVQEFAEARGFKPSTIQWVGV
jgi:proteasome-associated ATPase